MQGSLDKTVCKICGTSAELVFRKTILNKYDNEGYYKCPNCGFLSVKQPYWLDEAYREEKMDSVDRMRRNLYLRNYIVKFVHKFLNSDAVVLDFAGGEGILTRLLIDKGINCRNYDKYVKSPYSEGFNIDKLEQKYDLISAIEVMEHFADPIGEIENILNHTDNYFFTTAIQPPEDLENWVYLVPETGRHISLYTTNSLAYIANKFNVRFYSDSYWCHFFTRNDYGNDFSIILSSKMDEKKLELKTLRRMIFMENSENASFLDWSPEYKKTKKKYKRLNWFYRHGIDFFGYY